MLDSGRDGSLHKCILIEGNFMCSRFSSGHCSRAIDEVVLQRLSWQKVVR